MTQSQELSEMASMAADQEVTKWMEQHLPKLRQDVWGQRLLYQSLVASFVIGLVAHVGGYYLVLSFPRGFIGLLADLLHALGWSLWTGVIVAAFTQVFPEVKRRQIKQWLEAYEALRREKAKPGGKHAGAVLKTARGGRAQDKQGPKRGQNRARKVG